MRYVGGIVCDSVLYGGIQRMLIIE